MAESSLLPGGYISTDGSQIVDANGHDVRIASIGWNENFTDIPGSVAQMAADGFNTIRVSWVDATLSADLPRIEQIVAAAAANGIKVILDHHTDEAGTAADGYGAQQVNGLWFDSGPGTDGTNGAGVPGTVTAAQFQADWVTVAQAFAGNSTVIGFDLDNEPTSNGNINWGQGGPTDIQAMYTTVGDAIQAVDPGALIIAEGPQEYSPPPAGSGMSSTVAAPEGDLTGVAADPVVLNVPNKVVYSVHEYPSTISGTSVDFGPAYIQQMNAAWGYLVTDNNAPVWIGEMGASLDGTADSSGSGLADEQAWASTLLGYMNGQDAAEGGPSSTGSEQRVSGDWWNWGYNPGQYPDGVLNADGSLNAAQEAVWSQLLPTATTSASAPGSFSTTPLCFLGGTLIATPMGEVPVEQLAVRDAVVTLGGRARSIVWIGIGRVLAPRGRRNAATPVVVRKGGLADNVPHRDLRVTKAHALYVDEVLIPVEFLVNHRSIYWDDRAQEVSIYHVELETHDVLLANGAPAESYRDDGNRWLFRNANSGGGLPPQEPCAPVLTGGSIVDAAWRRLLDRAGPRPGVPMTDDPDLHLIVNGQRMDAISRRAQLYVFCLPTPPITIRIASRTGVPQELGLARDPRPLGVALREIVMCQGIRVRTIEAENALLTEGFHGFEAGNNIRWTDGDASVPADLFDGFAGPLEIALRLGGSTIYVDPGAVERVA